jgi:F-type H+-transporting ATPase subunit b
MAEKVNTGTTGYNEAAHLKVFSPLDATTFVPQLVWLALSFGLLYVLLKRFALPRVGEVITERRDRIERDLERAETLKAETQQALENYEKALADARSRAHGIANEVRGKLMQEVEGERARIDAQISRQIGDAEQRISASKAKALAGVNDIAAETAGAIVAKLIGKEISRDEVQRALTARAAE